MTIERNTRPDAPKPRTLNPRRARRLDIAVGQALYPERPGVDYQRPQTRADCKNVPRPCPFVSCRYHLALDVSRTGGLKLNHPTREPWELGETCALDVAERGPKTLLQLRPILNITREGIRQIEVIALRKLGKAASVLRPEPRRNRNAA